MGIYAAIDYTGSMTSQTVYILKQKKGNVVPLEYYLALLNSRVVYYYYLKIYGENEWKSHPYLTKQIIFSLPVIPFEGSSVDAVSVVTKNAESDDANGCNIEGNTVWLQVTRCGQSFAFHYSTDGVNFYMMRFFNMSVGEEVKVGLLAQAPTGNGGVRIYENLTIEKMTVKNIRFGK